MSILKKIIYILLIVILLCIVGLITYKVISKIQEKNKYSKELKEIKSFDCRNLCEDEMFEYEIDIIHSISTLRNTDVYFFGGTETRYKIAKEALRILKTKKCVSHIYYDERSQVFTFEIGDTLSLWELKDRNPLYD